MKGVFTGSTMINQQTGGFPERAIHSAERREESQDSPAGKLEKGAAGPWRARLHRSDGLTIVVREPRGAWREDARAGKPPVSAITALTATTAITLIADNLNQKYLISLNIPSQLYLAGRDQLPPPSDCHSVIRLS